MTVTGRYYQFAAGGLHRLSKRVLEGLINGTDALPQYAGTKQRIASVTLDNDRGFPIEIQAAHGEYLQFSAEGKIERRDLALAAFRAMETHENLERSRRVKGPIVDSGPSIKRELSGELSKEDLDMIATDIWGTLPEANSELRV